MVDISFTARAKPWLNKFINDLADDVEQVKQKARNFPGNKEVIEVALDRGPECLNPKDPYVCKEIFNFIEWYSTGKISNIEVTYNEKQSTNI